MISQLCSLASAQTTPSPLQAEVDEAEARAKIAKAKKEELEAKFPAPDADALKGSTDVKGNLIESQVQAYKAMGDISRQIAKNVPANVQGLYVFRESDFAKIVSYKKLIQQLKVINGEYTKCGPVAGAGVAAVPPGVLAGLFLKWLPLIKTETSLVGTDVVIEDEAVWANLANELFKKGIKLRNPYVSNFDFSIVGGVPATNLITELLSAETSSLLPVCNNPYKLKLEIDATFNKLKKDIGLVVESSTPQKKTTTTTTTVGPPEKS